MSKTNTKTSLTKSPKFAIGASVVGRGLVCLLLTAAMGAVANLGEGTAAHAASAPALVPTYATLPDSLVGNGSLSVALNNQLASFNQQVVALQPRAEALQTEEQQLTKQEQDLTRRAGSDAQKATQLQQRAEQYNSQMEAHNEKVEAHNAEPHEFQIPKQAAAAAEYDAEAEQLNAEGVQLRAEKNSIDSQRSKLQNELSQLDKAQQALTAAVQNHDESVQQIQSDAQQLEPQAQQLLHQMALAMTQAMQNPTVPADTMADGGDATRPVDQGQQQTQSLGNPAAAGDPPGGDSPSRAPQNASVRAYAQQQGGEADIRPGTAYLSPSAVSKLPASQAAQLGSPSGDYDGLVRGKNGTYTAVQVQRTTSPSSARAQRKAFDEAIERGGRATTVVDGQRVVIDYVAEVPESHPTPEPTPTPTSTARPVPAPSGGQATPSASPTRQGEAPCITAKPGGAVQNETGWILNTSEPVPKRNKTTTPNRPFKRATEATACLTSDLKSGTGANGVNPAGWQDAQKFWDEQSQGGEIKGLTKRDQDLARCHLIANRFGGRGKLINLFPCWQIGTNTGPGSMAFIEEMVARRLNGSLPSGAAILYQVVPNYKGLSSTIPESVAMDATLEYPDGELEPIVEGWLVQNVFHGAGPNLAN